jgi:Pyruvate/2-oxoacid:ferredoxin oxidoreductase gamma subunit
MERSLMMTGIGGQGVQLAAQVLTRAALAEGHQVQLFGSYGGVMRGGNTEATLVVADGPIEAPPMVDDVWAAMLMHHDYSESTRARLRAGSYVFVNSTVYEGDLGRADVEVVEIPATDLAVEIGNIMTASMVMAAAFAASTHLVALDALTAAVATALPSYRKKHIELNVRALQVGFEAAPAVVTDAWAPEPSIGALR